MAKKPTITTVASGYYGRQALNTNFENIRNQFDNTLSLDGSTPNALNANLDLNSNDLLNGKDGEFTNSLIVKGVNILDALGNGVGPGTRVFDTRDDLIAEISGGWNPSIGQVATADGIAWLYVGSGSIISDMPKWTFFGQPTLLHWGAVGTDIGSGVYYDATPVADEYATIQTAFNYCVANGLDLVGKQGRVYGVATPLNWGSTATVTPKGDARLDDFRVMWIGTADSAIAKTDPDPDNWAWTTNTPVLRVGNRAGDTDKYRVTVGPNVRVDGRRIKNCIQFRGLEDVDIECFAVRGLDYEALIGVPGNNSAATTDCKIKVRGWHYAYEENSSGVFGVDDGTGHYGPTGRTSSGVVVYSSDVFVEPHLARGKHNLIVGSSYGVAVSPTSKVYSGPDRSAGVNAMIITPGANRYTWIGGDIQDGGLRIMSGNGKIIGLTLAQYTHNMVTLVSSTPGETFASLHLTNSRFGGGTAEVVLETIGSGTWGAFAGTFYGNKNGNGVDMTIQGRKFNIGGVVDPFLTFADFVTAVVTYGWSPADNTTVTIGGLSWQKIPVGHALYGTNPISALPGWMPVGDVFPEHCAENSNPGVTPMAAAINEALAITGHIRVRPTKYLLDQQVSVPTGGGIQGLGGLAKRRVATDGSFVDDPGTIFLVNHGSGIAEATLANYYANAAFKLNDATYIKGVSFWYPDINVSLNVAPTAFPPAISTAEDVRGVTIEEVNLGNAYVGIDVTRDNRNVTINNIIGFPVYKGIATGSGATPIEISRVSFFANNVFSGSTWINPSNNIAVWVQGNGVGLDLRRTTWSNFVDVFAFGYSKGVDFGVTVADATNGINIAGAPHNVNIRGGGFDTCVVGIFGDGFQGRLSISDCSFAPLQSAGYTLSPAPSFYRAIHLVSDPTATVKSVAISAIRVFSTRQDAIYLEGHDTAKITACAIDAVGETVSGVSIRLVGCPRSTVTGNTLICGSANVSKGIVLEGSSDHSTVTGNTLKGFDGNPIEINGADYCTITGNTGDNNVGPLVVDVSFTKKYNNVLSGNVDDRGVYYDNLDVSSNILNIDLINLSRFASYSGTSGISGLPHGRNGDLLTLRFSAVCTVTDQDAAQSQENRLYMAGNLVTSFGTTLTLRSAGNLGWYETSRSVN